MKTGTVVGLNVAHARAVSINGSKVMTAIGKRAVEGERAVLPLGIEGDEQADLSVHGGLGKAVYAYPSEHYPFWKTVRAQAQVALWDEELPFGSLGENLTLQGVVESDLWTGDLLCFPGCQLAVSQPRFPCYKFVAAIGFRQAAKLMIDSAWCGAYLAVRVPGTIAAGQSFTIEPGPRQVGIAEVFRARMRRAAAA